MAWLRDIIAFGALLLLHFFGAVGANERVTCVGGLPTGWSLPIFSDWNPNGASLHEVCTAGSYITNDPQGPQRALAADCGRAPARARQLMPPIIFKTPTYWPQVGGRAPAHLSYTDLRNPRLELYCRNRCFCNFDLSLGRGTDRLPADNTNNVQVYKMPSDVTYEIKIHNPDDFNPESHHRGSLQRTSVWSTSVFHWRTAEPGLGVIGINFRPRELHISVHPDNTRITCRGRVDFDIYLPEPHDISSFPSNQKLCAIAQAGGNSFANAGGYCHPRPRSSISRFLHPGADTDYEVRFSDEFTPRPAWTWSFNSRFAGALRYYCHQACRCSNSESRSIRTYNKPVRLSHNVKITKASDNGIDIVRKTSAGKTRKFRVAPPNKSGKSGGSLKKQCVVAGINYCEMVPWPAEILGPLPNETWSETIEEEISSDIPMCGLECNGPSSTTCPGASSDSDCKCILLPSVLASTFGLDPIAPPALCLVRTAVVAMLSQAVRPSSRLNGRSTEHRLLEDIPCVCNGTYASVGCCDNSDGLVWEHPGLNVMNEAF